MKIALLAADYEFSRYARCLSQMEGVQWVGYFLTSAPEGKAVPCGGEDLPRAYSSSDALIDTADAVVVAGKAGFRFDAIAHALRRGKAVWSAWPAGASYQETRKLSALAEEARVCNQVAHLSRRHPVLIAAQPYLETVRVIRAEIYRSPEKKEAEGMDELLFPYIDRVLSLVSTPVRSIRTIPVPVSGRTLSAALVTLEFHSGLFAEFWINLMTGSTVEHMQCTGSDTVADLDFLSNRVGIRRDSGSVRDGNSGLFQPELVPNRPLADDLAFFVQACKGGAQGMLTFAESANVQETWCRIRKSMQPYA